MVALTKDETTNLPLYDSAAEPHPFVAELREVWRYRELVMQWTSRNLTLRYKRSILGVFWTLLEPLLMTTVLATVFGTVFRFSLANYPVYLLSGLLAHDLFNRSINQIVAEVSTSGSLAQRIRLPRSVFAVSAVLAMLVNWSVTLVPLLGLKLILADPPTLATLLAAPGVLLLASFALGVGLLVTTVGIRFPDFKVAFQVVLTAWFYATPIIYPLEIAPASLRPWMVMNPLYSLIRVVRDPLYLGSSPSAAVWLAAAASSLLALVLGWWVFTRWRSTFEYTL